MLPEPRYRIIYREGPWVVHVTWPNVLHVIRSQRAYSRGLPVRVEREP